MGDVTECGVVLFEPLDCVSIETSAGSVVCANQPVLAVVYTANRRCLYVKFPTILAVGFAVLPLLCGVTGSMLQPMLAKQFLGRIVIQYYTVI